MSHDSFFCEPPSAIPIGSPVMALFLRPGPKHRYFGLQVKCEACPPMKYVSDYLLGTTMEPMHCGDWVRHEWNEATQTREIRLDPDMLIYAEGPGDMHEPGPFRPRLP